MGGRGFLGREGGGGSGNGEGGGDRGSGDGGGDSQREWRRQKERMQKGNMLKSFYTFQEDG